MFCPKTEMSWCQYGADILNKTKTYKCKPGIHNKTKTYKCKPGIHNKIFKLVKPVLWR